MVRIHFLSGKVQETEQEWAKVAPKLQYGGLRLWRLSDKVMVPLNSSTIEFIENVPEYEELFEEAQEEAAVEETPVSENPAEDNQESSLEVDEKDAEKPQEEEKRMTQEEMLAHMKELSECVHEEHNIYYSESLVGKAKKPVRRFFPVCKKCGVREKFVKAEILTDEEKENAKIWDR